MSSIIRVSTVKTAALVVVALAAPGRSTMVPTSYPTNDDYYYDHADHGFNATSYTPPCEGSTPDFRDVFGDTCRFYERFDKPGCPEYGDDGDGWEALDDDIAGKSTGIARDHCCYCWMEAPSSSPTLTNQPTTETRTPTPPIPTMAPHDDDFMYWNPFSGWPTPAPPCEGSTPNFLDALGNNCAIYEAFETPGCPVYGDSFEGPMGTAREHCCYCKMEAPSSSPTLTNQPTTATRAPTTSYPSYTPTVFMHWHSHWYGSPAPTVSSSPTVTPKPTPQPLCEGSTPGWVDSVGDDCSWYELYDDFGCPISEDYVGQMGPAKENCCFCSMEPPTSAPSVSSSPTITPAPTEPLLCEGSTPNFKDSFGDSCEWYEMADEPGCPLHGDDYGGAMGVARDHCCYCKLSTSPTPSPPDIEDYDFKGHGHCTSDDRPVGYDIHPAEGFENFDITVEECASACAAEYSNDPLFRGINWMDALCFCLKDWPWEEAGTGEITRADNEFGNMLCYAFTSESTTESQESNTTETPAEAITGLWESLFGG